MLTTSVIPLGLFPHGSCSSPANPQSSRWAQERLQNPEKSWLQRPRNSPGDTELCLGIDICKVKNPGLLEMSTIAAQKWLPNTAVPRKTQRPTANAKPFHLSRYPRPTFTFPSSLRMACSPGWIEKQKI